MSRHARQLLALCPPVVIHSIEPGLRVPFSLATGRRVPDQDPALREGGPLAGFCQVGAESSAMGVLARRGHKDVAAPVPRHEMQKAFYRRAAKWLSTTVVTWPVWALTGAPMGLPRVVADHHHVVATAGIWPVYLMVVGLADLARKARKLYTEPVLEAAAVDTESEDL